MTATRAGDAALWCRREPGWSGSDETGRRSSRCARRATRRGWRNCRSRERDGFVYARAVCNLYSLTKSQDEIRRAFRIDIDRTGNMPPLPGNFPNTSAPIVHVADGRCVLSMYRWGMPSPAFALEGKRVNPGVTNVRNTGSPHWRRWLRPEHRCLVPLSSFSEFNSRGQGGRLLGDLGPAAHLPLALV